VRVRAAAGRPTDDPNKFAVKSGEKVQVEMTNMVLFCVSRKIIPATPLVLRIANAHPAYSYCGNSDNSASRFRDRTPSYRMPLMNQVG